MTYSRRTVKDHETIMNKDLYDNLQDGIDELKTASSDLTNTVNQVVETKIEELESTVNQSVGNLSQSVTNLSQTVNTINQSVNTVNQKVETVEEEHQVKTFTTLEQIGLTTGSEQSLEEIVEALPEYSKLQMEVTTDHNYDSDVYPNTGYEPPLGALATPDVIGYLIAKKLKDTCNLEFTATIPEVEIYPVEGASGTMNAAIPVPKKWVSTAFYNMSLLDNEGENAGDADIAPLSVGQENMAPVTPTTYWFTTAWARVLTTSPENITESDNLVLPICKGGTGATTLDGIINNLGVLTPSDIKVTSDIPLHFTIKSDGGLRIIYSNESSEGGE